ncbi:unnamed protein product [Symbiodinium sp. CCMP2592]|nr:unnamed protein product [Symbiodinium sp. CCMP2592]
MPPKKRPAAIAADDDEEEPRKSRKGFKEWHKLRDALLPFIDKRFFTSYPTDRSIAKIDKKKLCSPFFVIKGILNNCRQLSPTWNFPDTVIKKALLGVLKHEDSIYCWVLDKAHLAEQVKEADRDAWSTTNSLRLSAAFRHYSQATLRQREWVPKAGAHKPLRRLASDEPTGKRRLRRVTGKQRDQSRDPPKAQPKAQPQDEETAAAFLANDWFLNTLDGMMGGFDPSASGASYLSPTPGPSRRRDTQLLESPTAAEPPRNKRKADEEAKPENNKRKPSLKKLSAFGDEKDTAAEKDSEKQSKEKTRKKHKKGSEKQSNEKAPEKQSNEKAPEKQSNEKAPEKQSNEKAPEKHSDKKAPKKHSDKKATEKDSDKKAPEKHSDKKAPEKHSDKKAPEKHSNKKAPEKQSEKAPEKQSEKAPEKQSEKAPENQSKQKAQPEQDKRQPGDIWWDYEMQRACLESQTGPVFSSKPFVKEDEVFAQFPDGLMWSVPHLVPADLESGLGLPAPTVPEQKPKATASKRKPKADKPIEDYVYSIIRCKYCTQGSKNPLIKVEAREDRHDATSRWVQKLQLVIRTGLSVRKAMHIAMTFADCYVYMNLNPAEINYRGCRDDLLGHDHDWEASALDWQTVNSLGLKHFPKSQLESS